MKMRSRQTLALSMLALVQYCSLAHGQVSCRALLLSGFERPAEIGRLLVGPNTTDRTKVSVYITVADSQLYAHSNYVTPGFDYPTKLTLDTRYSLDVLVMNLLESEPGQISQAELRKLIRDNIHFFVDRFRLERSIFAGLDFSEARNVTWDPPEPKEVKAISTMFRPEVALRQPANSKLIAKVQDTSGKELPQDNSGTQKPIVRQDEQNTPPGPTLSHNPRPQGFWNFVQGLGPDKLIACSLGVIFLAVLMCVAIFDRRPTGTSMFIYRVILSLAAAGFGAVLPGLINIDIPFVRAGGALALFVLVYRINPPALVS
jgi:hypothetical protein